MRKLLRQELLTINYSSRYPNLLVPPLLMQMTAKPAGSFGTHALSNTHHLLTVTPIQRVNGKLPRQANSRYWPRIAAHLHFITRTQDRLPLLPASLFLSSSSSPGSPPLAFPFSLRSRLPGFFFFFHQTSRQSLNPRILLFNGYRQTTPINYPPVNEFTPLLPLLLLRPPFLSFPLLFPPWFIPFFQSYLPTLRLNARQKYRSKGKIQFCIFLLSPYK